MKRKKKLGVWSGETNQDSLSLSLSPSLPLSLSPSLPLSLSPSLPLSLSPSLPLSLGVLNVETYQDSLLLSLSYLS
jgi:hypothetical protein